MGWRDRQTNRLIREKERGRDGHRQTEKRQEAASGPRFNEQKHSL